MEFETIIVIVERGTGIAFTGPLRNLTGINMGNTPIIKGPAIEERSPYA